jgi:DNA-binding transcriptional LysR family regulator
MEGDFVQIDTLRYFVELARVGSFYGAAKNVYISQ